MENLYKICANSDGSVFSTNGLNYDFKEESICIENAQINEIDKSNKDVIEHTDDSITRCPYCNYIDVTSWKSLRVE